MPSWMPEAWQSGLMLAGLSGLVLYNSAVLAEIMRAGILSLAARAGRGRAGARARLPPGDAPRDPAAGPAADGAGHRVAADHAQQGHDAGLDHRHHRGHAPRAHVTATSGNPSRAAASRRRSSQVFLFVGLLFIVVNFSLSRLSRRLEIRERARTGAAPKPKVRGLEEQVA